MHRTLKLLLIALLSAISAAAATNATAQAAVGKPEIYTGRFSSLAVGGYDTVSYFDDNPVKGSAEFSTEYKGAEWRFVSQANLDIFLADPEAYAPQYGGYCAWAMAQGKFAKGDPQYWNIVEGKLYLNFNKKIQDMWQADIPGFIAKADAIWPGILDK